MNTLHTIAMTLAALWVFWLLYVFTMGLYRAFLMGRLKGFRWSCAAPPIDRLATLRHPKDALP